MYPLFQYLAGTEYADLSAHNSLHLGHDRGGVLRAPAIDQGIDFRFLAAKRFLNQTGRNTRAVLRALAKVSDELTDDHAGGHRLGHRVSAQPVKTMHVPAGRF